MASPKRPEKIEDGIIYLICSGPFHDNEWVVSTRFANRDRGRWRTYCRECETYISAQRRGVATDVKIKIIQKWLFEIIERCGGFNNANRTMGLSPNTVERWIGRRTGNQIKRIRYKNAKLILETLAHLRDGTLVPTKVAGKTRRTFKLGCKGCGVNIDEYNNWCTVCKERLRSRQRRAA